MQMPKEDVRNSILAAAREEFLKNGFEKASVRKITAAAKTSKSNVYNYFQDKDDLFAAVVEPTLSALKKGMEELKAGNRERKAATYSMEAQGEVIIRIMEFVFHNAEDFKLLLFCSSGSSLSKFKDQATGALAEVLSDWIAIAAPDKGISEYFIQMVAGFYIGSMEQMLARGITKDQAASHFEVFLKFVYGGWKAVLS
jgi:AcrR family transcriptional regulator